MTPPEPHCPACGSGAVEPYIIEHPNGLRELRAACKLGHAWTTTWLELEAS